MADRGGKYREGRYSREETRERERNGHGSQEKSERKRSRSRDRKRHRSRSNERSEKRSEPSAEDKKKERLAKLAAWKTKQTGSAAATAGSTAEARPEPEEKAQPSQAWMPWEDPTAVFTASAPESVPPPRLTPMEPPPAPVLDDGVDPLDAFMAKEIDPEVQAKEAEEAKKRERELAERAKQRAEGKIPKLDKILEDSSDEDDQPDSEVQVPEHKVKLVVGPGGERIKLIQRKSKCRLQIKKSEDELQKGFLEKRSYALPKPRKPGDEVKMVTIMLFGNAKECDIATRMIDEAIENKEQKQKQREKEYERKRDVKSRDRQLYYLRHTYDYETLGIPIGSSKADARKAYRELAKKWHPDKHPENVEEAKERFQKIQKAFESLMTTDEDARIEALAH